MLPSRSSRGEPVTDEQELKLASDAFLARVERLNGLEDRKRSLAPSSPDLVATAHEVETLSREIFELAQRQTTLAVKAASGPDEVTTPIASAAPRALHAILDDWRDAERALVSETYGSAAWEGARADVERFRDEYARAYQAHNRDRA
jgi:hypothetical protein